MRFQDKYHSRAGAMISLSALLISLLAAPESARAQDDVSADSSARDEIIITASRRAMDLQDTPLAVSVFGSAFLDAARVDNPQDLQFFAPGLVISDYGVPQIYIRGVGSNTAGVGADASATIHLDGVYLARTYPAFLDFLDVERVEVLRGPQGTLYGRNSTAGTINIISRAPSATPTMEADVLYGADDRVRLRGTVSGPIVQDKILARLTGSYNRRDGLYTNVVDGRKLDNKNTKAVRGTLEFRPADTLTLTLRGDYTRQRETGGISKMISADPMLAAAGAIFPEGDYLVAFDDRPFFDVNHWGIALDTNWNPGAVALRSITAFRSFKSKNFFDTDGTNLPLAHGSSNEKSDTFTQEIQVLTPAENPLSFIFGLYFLSDDARATGGTTINPGGIVFDPALIPPEGVLSNFDPRTILAGFPQGGSGVHDNDTRAYAAFAEGTYRLSPVLKFTAGVRYSYEEKKSVVDLGLGVSSAKANWDALTPRFVLEWTPNKDFLIYGTLARGFKSGGFNSLSATPFDPEYVWNREIGIKASFFDNKLHTNIAAFDASYKDFQVQILGEDLTSQVANAGKASTRGIELEFDANPLPGLRLNGSAAWLDADYKRFSITDITLQFPTTIPGFGVINFPILTEFDQAGRQMFNAPEWMVSLGAQYTAPLSSDLELTARIDYQWQDKARTSRLYTRDSFDLVNLSLALGSVDKNWTVTVFGKNIFDTHYVSYGSVQPPLWGNVTSRVQGEPATWGVQLGTRF